MHGAKPVINITNE